MGRCGFSACLVLGFRNLIQSDELYGGEMAQEVTAVVWQSEGCRFDPTLGVSKCP